MSISVPPARPAAFNWADSSDSESDSEQHIPTVAATPAAVAADAPQRDETTDAARELNFDDNTPVRHCQEVTIQAAIPYTLKSVWNASTAPTAAAPAANTTIRMNRALDELTNVLRDNNQRLPYNELMAKSQWRSRFQPSFGSLFTFIKRNRSIFRYKQSVVELVEEANIVAELLKINWQHGVENTPNGSAAIDNVSGSNSRVAIRA